MPQHSFPHIDARISRKLVKCSATLGQASSQFFHQNSMKSLAVIKRLISWHMATVCADGFMASYANLFVLQYWLRKLCLSVFVR